MVKKDRSTFLNKDYLLIMLPKFYKTHLKSQLNMAEYILLKIMIILLQSLKKVTCLPQAGETGRRYQNP